MSTKQRQIAKPKVNEAEKCIHSVGKHNKNGERMNNCDQGRQFTTKGL